MHIKAGFIVSCNRNGFIENFPIATLSIAAVTESENGFDLEELSKKIAAAKKQSKKIKGDSVIIV